MDMATFEQSSAPRQPFWDSVPPCNQALDSKTFCPPPLDGSLTLPEIYDWHRERSPNHRLFIYARSNGTIRNITYSEAVIAIYRAARLVRERVQSHEEAPVVAILSASETIAFFTTQHGIMRSNYVPFPISPRNSAIAVAHLIAQAKVEHVLVGAEDSTRELLKAALNILKEWYPSTPVPGVSSMFVFDELFDNLPSADDGKDLPVLRRNPDDVALYLHSSGSTSQFPKLIPWTIKRMIELSLLPFFGERDLCDTVLGVHGLPLYHSMGSNTTNHPAGSGSVLACFEPQSPPVIPTADNLATASKMTGSDFMFGVPSFIEEWSHQPELRKWLATRSGVLFGGGTLDKESGDSMISEGIQLFTGYGLTEAGVVNPLLPKQSLGYDWDHFTFAKNVKPELIPQGDGTFELVLLATPFNNPSVINTKIRGEDAYATSDLIVPHPTKEGLWKVYGRCDDQIMHSSGEKTNPGPLESILNQDPLVQSSVIFGRGQFQAGALIQPAKEWQFDPEMDQDRVGEFRNKIWPTVERMNEFAPQHSRLFKEMILIAKPSKPFSYTAKGTPRRQIILQDYEEEISQLYASIEDSAQPDIPPPTNWDTASSAQFVRAVVAKILLQEIEDEADLFRHGCDSLQATWIRNSLLRSLRESINLDIRQSTKNFVYDYPSIAQLGKFLSSVARNGFPEVAKAANQEKVEAMRAMAKKYSSDFPKGKGRKTIEDGRKVVLVTGTTGGLGSYLLASLAADEAVSTVYAFNRKNKESSLDERQRRAFREKGIDEGLLNPVKVKMVEADLLEKDFGMNSDEFGKMRDSVTHVIHNAWHVNFNAALLDFESNVQDLRALVDFSLACGSRLIFIGSVGVFQQIGHDSALLEHPVPADMAAGLGYAESKWVAEQILLNAIQTAELDALIVRVGQLCGSSTTGAWNMNEWAPALIQSATVLECLPVVDGTISWIPTDLASRAVLDLLDVQDTRTEPILHLRHPYPVEWNTLMNALAPQLKVTPVSYAEWLRRLEEANSQQLVATRLLAFFQHIPIRHDSNPHGLEAFATPHMDITTARKMFKSFAEPGYPTVDGALAKKWLESWQSRGELVYTQGDAVKV